MDSDIFDDGAVDDGTPRCDDAIVFFVGDATWCIRVTGSPAMNAVVLKLSCSFIGNRVRSLIPTQRLSSWCAEHETHQKTSHALSSPETCTRQPLRCAARASAPTLLSAPLLAEIRTIRFPSGDDGDEGSGASPLSVQSTRVHVLKSPSAEGSYDRYSRAPVSTVTTSAGAPLTGFLALLALIPHLGFGRFTRLDPPRLGLFFVEPPAMASGARPTLESNFVTLLGVDEIQCGFCQNAPARVPSLAPHSPSRRHEGRVRAVDVPKDPRGDAPRASMRHLLRPRDPRRRRGRSRARRTPSGPSATQQRVASVVLGRRRPRRA